MRPSFISHSTDIKNYSHSSNGKAPPAFRRSSVSLSFERRRWCWIRNRSRKAIVNITTPRPHSGMLQLRLVIFVPVTTSDLISECANCANCAQDIGSLIKLLSTDLSCERLFHNYRQYMQVYARKPPLLSDGHLLLTEAVIRSSVCLASPLPLFA